MKTGLLKGVLCSALVLGAGVTLHAQRGPGGGGGGQRGGSMPGGFPGNPGGGVGGFPSAGRNNAPALPSSRTRESNNTRNRLQLGPPGRWWDDKTFAKTLGLRKDQQKKMDFIFNQNKPSILESYNTLQREQSRLDALTQEPKPDQARIFAQIDVVNQARSSLEKEYAQMQLQIRQQMEPDQLSRMDKYREKPPDDSVN
jgi:Spy/CpxP family protein refolding chaperone